MEEIKAFRTKDNKIFEDYNLAVLHENRLDLEFWYENNKLYSDDGSSVDLDDLLNWLNINGKKINIIEIIRQRK